jgi:hypothetical protein
MKSTWAQTTMLSAAGGKTSRQERTRLAVAVLLGHLGKRVRDVLRRDLDLRGPKSQWCVMLCLTV